MSLQTKVFSALFVAIFALTALVMPLALTVSPAGVAPVTAVQTTVDDAMQIAAGDVTFGVCAIAGASGCGAG